MSSLARNLGVLALLAGLLAVQAFAPAHQGQPLPRSDAAADELPALATLAAVSVPGVDELLPRLPFQARALGLDPSFAADTLRGRKLSPDENVFPKPAEPKRPFVLNGHGTFHHLTYFVLRDLVEPLGADYTLVNFDAHDDARSAQADVGLRVGDGLDCGNWTRFALDRLPHLKRVVQIGRSADYGDLGRWLAPQAIVAGRFDLYPARPLRLFFSAQPELTKFDGLARRDLLAAGAWQLEPRTFAGISGRLSERIVTRDVYVTVDLDVIRFEDFDDLGWGNGVMARDDVIAAIDEIAKSHRVIGADISGYPLEKPGKLSCDRCVETYRRIAEALQRGANR